MLLHDDDDVDEWIGSIGTNQRENGETRHSRQFAEKPMLSMAMAEAGVVMKRRATLAISTCGLGLLMVMSYMQVRCN